jgi:toxin FitB
MTRTVSFAKKSTDALTVVFSSQSKNQAVSKLWVVDTSAWIEWLQDGAVRNELLAYMPKRENCVVPTIVQLELSKWLMRNRSEEDSDVMMAYTQTCQVWPLDATTAFQAAELHREYKLATADAIVYASALLSGAQLLTCDAHFEGLPQVHWIHKI